MFWAIKFSMNMHGEKNGVHGLVWVSKEWRLVTLGPV